MGCKKQEKSEPCCVPGPQGPQGRRGKDGKPAPRPAYAYVWSRAGVLYAPGDPIQFENDGGLFQITHPSSTRLLIQKAGIYAIDYFLRGTSQDGGLALPIVLEVRKNGTTILSGTRYESELEAAGVAKIVVANPPLARFEAGDFVEVINVSSTVTTAAEQGAVTAGLRLVSIDLDA